jgi:P27 family predicted phage terminase small subunit
MTPPELQPPQDLTAAELAEWIRITAAVEATGHALRPADRSILVIYVRTWHVFATCCQHVREFGPVIKWPNGMPGPSPQYKTMRETATLLRGLLADLGATPASRNFDQAMKDAASTALEDLPLD